MGFFTKMASTRIRASDKNDLFVLTRSSNKISRDAGLVSFIGII